VAPNDLVPRSLLWATDIDVLPLSRELSRHDDHLTVRSPSNPDHWWGNMIVFDDAPRAGDGERWERLFADEISAPHRAFAWDRTDDAIGAAETELVARGYELERCVGLVGTPAQVREHPRANREVAVRALRLDGDEDLWEQVIKLQVADREPDEDQSTQLAYQRRRQADLRELFAAGRGGWYVALDGDEVVSYCGIVVCGGRGRYQTVGTAEAHRGRGICSRLVVEAAQHAARVHGARRLVIAADPDYHALGIYESLGFRRAEAAVGALRKPRH
ncbi:MAG: GNAT family N-acetyltransferase, partial [Solirubrobacteraceae bacterium]